MLFSLLYTCVIDDDTGIFVSAQDSTAITLSRYRGKMVSMFVYVHVCVCVLSTKKKWIFKYKIFYGTAHTHT